MHQQMLSPDAINARCLVPTQLFQGLSSLSCAYGVMQVFENTPQIVLSVGPHDGGGCDACQGCRGQLNAWYHALVEMPVGASSRFRYLRQNLPGSLSARQHSSSFWHFSQARRFLRRSALYASSCELW